MLAVARHRAILKLLESQGSVRTAELAERLEVTDETIRRDLEKLEREGHLQRSHGGAIRTQHILHEQSFAEREVQNIEAKAEIADVAVRLIQPGERIFIDASSTALQMVKRLPSIPLTIMTNSLIVLSQLSQLTRYEVIGVGGRLDVSSQSLVGSGTRAALRRYRIDKAFCSGNGIDTIRGLSESNEQQSNLKEALVPLCNAFIFLADHSKLGVSSNFFFCDTRAVDVLVTNSEAYHPCLEELAAMGVEVMKASPASSGLSPDSRSGSVVGAR